MQAVYDRWIEAGEAVYARAARGQAFLEAQAELTNSLSQLRIAQRELVEEWARQFDAKCIHDTGTLRRYRLASFPARMVRITVRHTTVQVEGWVGVPFQVRDWTLLPVDLTDTWGYGQWWLSDAVGQTLSAVNTLLTRLGCTQPIID